ncbi:unnamed protein product [Camellia sinensis]
MTGIRTIAMTYNNALEVSPQWNLPLRIYLKIWKNKCRGSCAKSGLARNVRLVLGVRNYIDAKKQKILPG